jgi:hypothetical protein
LEIIKVSDAPWEAISPRVTVKTLPLTEAVELFPDTLPEVIFARL